MTKPCIIVTGASGQLAKELQHLSTQNPLQYNWLFASREMLDITDRQQVKDFFAGKQVAACINTAAYTAVDKAESDQATAWQVNAEAPVFLAQACAQQQAALVHISTDFVFDGRQGKPYTEKDATYPLNVYGKSKLEGEQKVLAYHRAMVIRTSWLYSSFGNNFVKTMLRLANERDLLRVVADQTGSPTYARDLASAILHLLLNHAENPKAFGLFQYSNHGVASWYDFATAIMELSGKHTPVYPIPATAYPVPAQRPAFSVMDKSAIEALLDTPIPHWRKSLAACLHELGY